MYPLIREFANARRRLDEVTERLHPGNRIELVTTPRTNLFLRLPAFQESFQLLVYLRNEVLAL